ncbi:uncharacterized protein LOC142334686 [Convolutriloba macropyga]|uniref:uncharacterized protein LOC142334686 n=1 Tax=Convolutriloba macropyga TaxID=536237 RepID=UPI003F52339F
MGKLHYYKSAFIFLCLIISFLNKITMSVPLTHNQYDYIGSIENRLTSENIAREALQFLLNAKLAQTNQIEAKRGIYWLNHKRQPELARNDWANGDNDKRMNTQAWVKYGRRK